MIHSLRWLVLIRRLENDLARLEMLSKGLPDPAALGVRLTSESATMYADLQAQLHDAVAMMQELIPRVKAERDY